MDKPQAMVLEDSRAFAKFLTNVLEQFGFEVYNARSHAEFVPMMEQRNYDLAVLDWAIEGDKDGIYCISEIKRWDSYPSRTPTPILLLSGIDSRHGEKHAINHGADAYLTKTEIEKDDLRTTILQIMEKINPHRIPERIKNPE